MSNFIKAIRNPYKVLFRLVKKMPFLANKIDDEHYIRLVYRSVFGKKLNLENPKTFNEKLQWLKLYDRKTEYTTMVDKYEAKKYVAQKIGEEYIIPTLGVWDDFDQINFDELPKQFVLKCTHDSGGLVIVKDKSKLDKNAARAKITTCLKTNFYLQGREWPYKDVKPRIIAEKYMEDSEQKELRDYKFFCFGGQVKCFKVDFDRFVEHHANYYDEKNNLLDLGEISCPPAKDKVLSFPDSLPQMKEIAEKLSAEIPFLRADFSQVHICV